MRLARTAPSDLMADKGNSFRLVTYVILALNFPHSMFCCIKLSLSLVIASYVCASTRSECVYFCCCLSAQPPKLTKEQKERLKREEEERRRLEEGQCLGAVYASSCHEIRTRME